MTGALASLTDQELLYLSLAVLVGLMLVVLLRRVLGYGLKVAARTAVGGGLLALLQPVGGLIGLHLGVNLWNALVIGFLGLPGLGLLMLLNWLVQ